MSTLPRLGARVSALERRQTTVEARVEEITEDITTSVNQLSEDMAASFKQLTDYLMKTEEENEKRFSNIETDVSTLKADVSTLKADVSTLKADVSTVKETLNQHTVLLTQILERLPR